MSIDASPGSWRGWVVASLCALALACAPHGHEHDDGHEHEAGHDEGHGHDDGSGDNWSVTAWGSHFEIFPEIDALVAGRTASAHVHVTRLEDFAPVSEGAVEIVLGSSPGEQVFRSETAKRPGLFTVELTPDSPAELDLRFRIVTPEATEELRGGRVRVGTAEQPGGIRVAPAPKGGRGGEPSPFLKEEQWRSDFATSWVRRGELSRDIEGLVRVRPVAGGEQVLSSPVAGRVRTATAWPFPGQPIARGTPVFRIVPQVAVERSLAELEAAAASLEIEKAAVVERLGRLEELLALEATSRREVEEVRQRAGILEARHRAASLDLEAARAARGSGSGGSDSGGKTGLQLAAPFDGEIAAVDVTPGATVAAGEALARLVRTDKVWLEMALSAADAAELQAPGSGPTTAIRGLVLSSGRGSGRGASIRLEEDVRLVAVAPEASDSTGTVAAFFEAPSNGSLVLGAVHQGQVLLDETRPGIVIPSSALVDDGGVSVVYLQLSGESFLRQEVDVLDRQGELALVEGLEPGQRLVHRGGDAIRRSSLMSSGEAHGHVH